MFQDYSKTTYELWSEVNGVTFERKLAYETAFDGVVKIYTLRTNNEQVNKLLEGHYFGEFGYPTSKGMLLRKFKSKTSWPKTRIVHLNLVTNELTEIKRTNSSWNIWTAKKLDELNYSVSISPTETVELEIG
ncbi:MAG: hypothetical protein ABJ004_00975 [Cyclobacteriaceae bacterium]